MGRYPRRPKRRGWDGEAGINSSSAAPAPRAARAVGYAEAVEGSLVVSFAAPGDTDLDGQVTVFDLVAIISAGRHQTGLASDWSEGDFSYDGQTGIFDLVEIESAGVYNQGSYFPAATAVTTGIVAVPEPATWLLAAAGFLSLAGRRRRLGRRQSSDLSGGSATAFLRPEHCHPHPADPPAPADPGRSP